MEMIEQLITDVTTVGWHCSLMAVDGRLTYRQRPIPGRSARGGGPRWYARSAAAFDGWKTPATPVRPVATSPKRMAKADMAHPDQIFSPIAAQLRARAKTYREKGYDSMALDLEAEAAKADELATMGLVENRPDPPARASRVKATPTPSVKRSALPIVDEIADEAADAPGDAFEEIRAADAAFGVDDDEVLEADGQPAPPRRVVRPPAKYKAGTRVEPKPAVAVVTRELPWWAKAKPGEMTKTAESQRERMQGSNEAKKVDGGKIS